MIEFLARINTALVMNTNIATDTSTSHAGEGGGLSAPPLWKVLSTAELMRLVPGFTLRINHVYLLHYPLNRLPDGTPPRLGSHELRPLQQQDLPALLEMLPSLDPLNRIRLWRRIQFFQQGFRNGFVLASARKIAYLQWLIYPSENALIRQLWSGRYRALADQEVLVEQAFCMPEFRGWGFHPSVTHDLLKQARQAGFRRAVTYIRKDNATSLNNFLPMGFRAVRLFREWTVFGHPIMQWGGLATT